MSKPNKINAVVIGLLVLNAVLGGAILWRIDKPERSADTTGSADTNAATLPVNVAEAQLPMPPPADQSVQEKPVEQNKTITNVEARTDTDTDKLLVARVNGLDIDQAHVFPYLDQLTSAQQRAGWHSLEDIPRELLSQAVDNAALDRLLVQQALAANIHQYQDIIDAIRLSEDNILKNALLELIAPKLVSDTAVEQRYTELVASLAGKVEYRARHILLANEKEAKIVEKALVEEKKSYQELAKLFSLDEASGLRGGDLGYQLEGQLDAEFEAQIKALAPGQASGPFQTKAGWHIALLEDKRDSKPMPFEQAMPIIRQKLQQQALQNYLGNLLENASIDMLVAE